MKTLECHQSDRYVNRAFKMSYEKCPAREQETLVCLSVFEGSFSDPFRATKFVIEKEEFNTSCILKKLVPRSVIKQQAKHRYSIHSLIKHFLKDQQKSGKQEAEEALAKAMRASELMVEYYLSTNSYNDVQKLQKIGSWMLLKYILTAH